MASQNIHEGLSSLVSRASHDLVFDHVQYAKQRGKAWSCEQCQCLPRLTEGGGGGRRGEEGGGGGRRGEEGGGGGRRGEEGGGGGKCMFEALSCLKCWSFKH